MKIKVYTVCARAQASIFMVFWPFSSKKLPNCWRNLNDERWSSEWSKVKTLEDNQGVDGRFFTNCVRTINEKVVSICLIIPKNRKVKKFQLYIIDQSFEHNGMDTKLPKKVGKPWFEKGGAHFMQACVRRICKLYTKGLDRPANSRDLTPLKTIWIIVDETDTKIKPPKHWTS